MKWQDRPSDATYLFNPAFCGEIIRRAVKSFADESYKGLPYPVAFLILPIVLHKETRSKIILGSRYQMHTWLQLNSSLRIGFAARARDYCDITRESLAFLLQVKVVTLDAEAKIRLTKARRRAGRITSSNEIRDCFAKAEYVGRWMARAGTPATIFTMWGVRP